MSVLIALLKASLTDVAVDLKSITLPQARIKDFGAISTRKFRRPKEVKVLSKEEQQMFMLGFFLRLNWPSRSNVLTVWQFQLSREGG